MYVKVKTTPGAKKEKVEKETEEIYRIQVKEPAANNLANARVRQLLARALGLNEGAVRLVSGHKGPNKKFEVSLKIKE